ncbi:MAG TPA: succinyl-diaminopimelate desuccinylase, partial [Gammaproteobacteria bacterium]|nr:succinyl-diaminopimelate desuccinylase [Gammaproteobacteria bacterium]
MSSTLDFARNLIRQPSVTPDDAGCQDLIADALQPAGFKAEFLTYGEVRNVWLRRGQVHPLLVFAGHTDVVPTGPIEQWHHPP